LVQNMQKIYQSLIQSNFGGEHGNFEAVVLEGNSLNHWWRDNSNNEWKRGKSIVEGNASGPGSIIQSDFGDSEHGNFEVVVPLATGDGKVELWHFWHDNSDVLSPWQRGQIIAANVTGPGSLIQSDFKGDDHGNFEVIVPVQFSLRHYWHDNSDVSSPWQRGQIVTDSARGWGCLIQSSFRTGDHGNFEVLAEECKQSLISYWHPNQDVNLPWIRHRVLLGEAYPSKRLTSTRKVVQLTGEWDRQGWNGNGTPPIAHNQTESRFGIRGTDLGASFIHKNRIYFLFGDTWRVNQSDDQRDLDSIAFTTDTVADGGISLTFNTKPPLIRQFSPEQQREFDVPLDGISVDDRMYVFFSTDHQNIDGSFLMGRSVLARSDNDGYDFDFLYEFSHQKFINVSIERATLQVQIDSAPELSPGTEVLWIWGSGRYRSSDVYLAVMPINQIASKQVVRYFAGQGESERWSEFEDDATPLFCAGDVGELSVRWNPYLRRYLALFNSQNPRGILMHSASQPWGVWSSEPVMVFDPGFREQQNDPCSGLGYGRFMHISWSDRMCDHVQDDMFTPGSFRDHEYGGEYGPYQITQFTAGVEGEQTQIYFTLSTWNPYQVMLMATVITSDFV
jgi:hypothetical protein